LERHADILVLRLRVMGTGLREAKMRLAQIRNGEIVAWFNEGKGRVEWTGGGSTSPAMAGAVSPDGTEKLLPEVIEFDDTSTRNQRAKSETITVEAARVLRLVTVTDVPVETLRDQASMPRRDFAIAALGEGWVTEAEAIAWAAGQAIPAWVEQIIDANIPEASRALVKIQTLTDPDVKRTGQLMPMLQSAKGVSDAALDALFSIA
jgi:hypothetical protein